MTGFEPRTSDVGTDHSANWATTSASTSRIFSLEKTILDLQRQKVNIKKSALTSDESGQKTFLQKSPKLSV